MISGIRMGKTTTLVVQLDPLICKFR
jgi:hypothetical protein